MYTHILYIYVYYYTHVLVVDVYVCVSNSRVASSSVLLGLADLKTDARAGLAAFLSKVCQQNAIPA